MLTTQHLGSAEDVTSAANPYARYAAVPELLALQHPLTDEPAEMSFLVVTQVMELYFKLLRHEWETARAQLGAGELRPALTSLRRGHSVQDALNASWEALRTLTPAEFNSFRHEFGAASGFQSYLYRHLEFLLGAKNLRLLEPHRGMPEVFADLEAELHAPSLYDAALGLLASRGAPIPRSVLTRDFSENYLPVPEVTAAWLEIYRDPQRYELMELGEALFDTAERFTRWRQRHLLSVWRSMGDKQGSAGSSGSRWLERIAHQKFFPELWALRTEV